MQRPAMQPAGRQVPGQQQRRQRVPTPRLRQRQQEQPERHGRYQQNTMCRKLDGWKHHRGSLDRWCVRYPNRCDLCARCDPKPRRLQITRVPIRDEDSGDDRRHDIHRHNVQSHVARLEPSSQVSIIVRLTWSTAPALISAPLAFDHITGRMIPLRPTRERANLRASEFQDRNLASRLRRGRSRPLIASNNANIADSPRSPHAIMRATGPRRKGTSIAISIRPIGIISSPRIGRNHKHPPMISKVPTLRRNQRSPGLRKK